MPPSRTRRVLPLLLTALALLAEGGCRRDRAGADDSADRTPGTTPLAGGSSFPVVHEDWSRLGYRLDWVGFPFPAVGRRGRVLSVDAYADVVVAQERSSTVTVLEAATGERRWSLDLAGPLTKFVGVLRDESDPNRLIVSSESEAFVLGLIDSALVGRERYAIVANTEPLLLNGQLVFGTANGEIMAHLLGRNVKAWGFRTGGSFDTRLVRVGDAVAGVAQTGDVVFLLPDGTLIGRARIFGGVSADPVSDAGILFVAGLDQSVWAFDQQGQVQWRHRTPVRLTVRPAVRAGTLYVEIPGSGLTAFEGATGKVLWTASDVRGTVIGARAGHLLVLESSGSRSTLVTLDPARGDVLERVSLPGVVSITTDAFEDGRLYAVSDRAVLAKFAPRN